MRVPSNLLRLSSSASFCSRISRFWSLNSVFRRSMSSTRDERASSCSFSSVRKWGGQQRQRKVRAQSLEICTLFLCVSYHITELNHCQESNTFSVLRTWELIINTNTKAENENTSQLLATSPHALQLGPQLSYFLFRALFQQCLLLL